MVTRCRFRAGAINEFGEDTSAGTGVDEGNVPAMHAYPRAEVDHLDTALSQRRQRRGQVVNQIGNVVNAWAAFGEKATQRRIVIQRGQQFDPTDAGLQGDDIDVLLVNAFTPGLYEAQCEILRDGSFEVIDHDANVMHRAGVGSERRHLQVVLSCMSRWIAASMDVARKFDVLLVPAP